MSPNRVPHTTSELVALNVEAMGGESAMKRISSLERTGKFTLELKRRDGGHALTMSGNSRRVSTPSRGVYACDEFGINLDEWGWHGDVAWRKNSSDMLRRLRNVDEIFVRLSCELVPLAALSSWTPLRLQFASDTTDPETGKMCHSIRFDQADGKTLCTALIARREDPRAYQVVAWSWAHGIPFITPDPIRIGVLEYEKVNGVHVERTIEATGAHFSARWAYTTFRTDQTFDEQVFAPPQPLVRYTRHYIKLLRRLIDGHLTPFEFRDRFETLFKWEPDGFSNTRHDALRRMRDAANTYCSNRGDCGSPAARDRLLEVAQTTLDRLIP